MTTLDNWDYQKLKETGVPPRIFARLMNVQPITASAWLQGRSKPHRLIATKANQLMRAVERLLDSKALPITKSYPLAEEKTIKQYVLLNRAMQDQEE